MTLPLDPTKIIKMKYLILLAICLSFSITSFSQSSVEHNKLLIGSDQFPNGTQTQPMMFYRQDNLKGALRSGYITDASWNADSLGIGTIGAGYDAKATGNYSASFGFKTNAAAESSIASGANTEALGKYSFAGGRFAKARSDYSFAFGKGVETGLSFSPEIAKYSVVFGDSASVAGSSSMSVGDKTLVGVLANCAQAFGFETHAEREYSTAFGYKTRADEPHLFVVGKYNSLGPTFNSGKSHLFVVGDGTGPNTLSNALIVNSLGNVGIGVNDPCQKLQIAGNITHTGVVACSSDKRYKKDIKQLPSTLKTIQNINPVRYNLRVEEFPQKNFSDKSQIGFIAQEIQKHYPEIVVEDREGYYSVDYGKMTPILLKAIQELSSKIEVLENELNRVKNNF